MDAQEGDMEKLLDIGSERALLASLLQYGIDAQVIVSDIISVDSFGNLNNKALYRCIEHVISNDQHPDIVTIMSAAEHLKLSERLKTEQELQYIKSLYDFPVTPENTLGFAVQMKKFEFARKIQKLTNKIHKDVGAVNGSESIDEVINILEEPVTDFLREDDGGENPEKIGDGDRRLC